MFLKSFNVCETKCADQLSGSCTAYQSLYFHYIDSTIIRNLKSKAMFGGVIIMITYYCSKDIDCGFSLEPPQRDKAVYWIDICK